MKSLVVYSVKCFALQNGRCRMRGKDLTISILLDAYGALLTERQRELVDLYYNEDLSLAEISENTGITRQGVRDGIKKSEVFLRSCEEKLGICEKNARLEALLDDLKSKLERDFSGAIPSDIADTLDALVQ